MDFRILVYSQDVQLFLLLRHILEVDGFATSLASSLDDIQKRLAEDAADAMIVDDSAPCVDFSALKITHPRITLVLLSRLYPGQLPSCNRPFVADFVVKQPFNPTLLVGIFRRLRIEALFETETRAAKIRLLRFADLEMDVTTLKVCRNGHEVVLTALQFRLLRHFLQNPKLVQTRDVLIATCWPRHIEVEPRTVDIHMGHIRRALMAFGPDLIRTVRAHGYALDMAPLPDAPETRSG